jgi:hypothetical protein
LWCSHKHRTKWCVRERERGRESECNWIQ